MHIGTRVLCGLCVAALAVGATAARSEHADMPTGTPPQLVAAYDSLADSILATKKTEWNLVHAILAMTYRHAQGAMIAAKVQMEAGQNATAEMEKLASLVSQIGNEGDATVAAIRKRLVAAGHHHHAGASEERYDPGFVIVTREAKRVFLDAAKKLARAKDVTTLTNEWKRVEKQFAGLHEAAR